ncbi:hypothetical protein C8R45DRAFT_1108005 [Mycena sanguinolenta]|nr:hypothetical protein C8R45DRAFT_1108005 [Mycena sanguinolenta]
MPETSTYFQPTESDPIDYDNLLYTPARVPTSCCKQYAVRRYLRIGWVGVTRTVAAGNGCVFFLCTSFLLFFPPTRAAIAARSPFSLPLSTSRSLSFRSPLLAALSRPLPLSLPPPPLSPRWRLWHRIREGDGDNERGRRGRGCSEGGGDGEEQAVEWV